MGVHGSPPPCVDTLPVSKIGHGLDREAFHDIMADVPWGFLSSLLTARVISHLASYDSDEPFPVGRIPDMMRTNPRTKEREKVVVDDLGVVRFLSEVPVHRQQLFKPVKDHSYCEIVLRMHPKLFMTLYEHYKKEWIPSGDHGNIRLRGGLSSCMVHPTRCARDSYVLERFGISLELLSALAHAYKMGRYQQLTLEEILCFESASLNCEMGRECLRHFAFEDPHLTTTRTECRGTLVVKGADSGESRDMLVRDCDHDPPCLRRSHVKSEDDAQSWASDSAVVDQCTKSISTTTEFPDKRGLGEQHVPMPDTASISPISPPARSAESSSKASVRQFVDGHEDYRHLGDTRSTMAKRGSIEVPVPLRSFHDSWGTCANGSDETLPAKNGIAYSHRSAFQAISVTDRLYMSDPCIVYCEGIENTSLCNNADDDHSQTTSPTSIVDL